MKNRTKFGAVLSASLVATAVAVLGFGGRANASAIVAQGPTSGDGVMAVAVPAQILDNKLTTISHPTSDPIPVSIPPGNYAIEQGSYDDAHPLQEDQPMERWFAVFSGPSGVVGTTSTTPDLATADTRKSWAGDSLVLTAAATSVTYYHPVGGDGPDSVYPDLLRLTPIKPTDPDPTTTLPAPTTLPPPTSPATTSPATTSPATTSPAKLAIPVVQVVTPVAVGPDLIVTTTAPVTTAPTTTAPTTTAPTTTAPPKVEVQGIEVEQVDPDIALTGSTTAPLLYAAIVFMTVGAVAVIAVGRRRARS
jgi:hypothetical protein